MQPTVGRGSNDDKNIEKKFKKEGHVNVIHFNVQWYSNVQNNQGLIKTQYVGMSSKLKLHWSQDPTWAASATTVTSIPAWVTTRNFHGYRSSPCSSLSPMKSQLATTYI